MKLFGKILSYLLVFAVGIVVLIVVALQLITDAQYKKWTVAAVQAATGRELTIGGDFALDISTKLVLEAGDISFANAIWASRDEMVSVERLFVRIDLFPLLRGILDITAELNTPHILLETDATGRSNWVFETEDKDGRTVSQPDEERLGGLPFKPYISNLKISNLQFAFKNPAEEVHIEAKAEIFRIHVDGQHIPLSLKGQYQGMPVELQGSLGYIEEWHNNEVTPISIRGNLGGDPVAVSGTVGPLLPQPDARLDISLAARNLANFSSLTDISLPQLRDLDLSLTAVADRGNLAAEDISIRLDDPSLMLQLTGSIDDVQALEGIDMSIDLRSNTSNELFEELKPESPYSLPQTIRLEGHLQGSLKELAVHDLMARLQDRGVDITLTGTLEDLTGRLGGAAQLAIELDSTQELTKFIGRDLPAFGPVTGEVVLNSTGEKGGIEAIRLQLSDPVLAVDLEGSAERIRIHSERTLEIEGIALHANARSDSLPVIVDRLGLTPPGAVPTSFSLSGSATGSLDTLSLDDSQLTVQDEGVEITVTAVAENIINQTGIDARFTAAIKEVAVLSKYSDFEVPELGSLSATGQVVSVDSTYRLNTLDAQLEGKALQAKLSAGIDDILALAEAAASPGGYASGGINATVQLNAPSVQLLARQAGREVPDLGALVMEGRLLSSEEALMVEELNALLNHQGFKTEISAVMDDVIALSGLRANVKSEVNSLSSLSELAGAELPETDPVALDIQMFSEALRSKPATLSAEVNSTGVAAHVDATFPDLLNPQTFQAGLVMDVDSIAGAGAQLGKEIPWERALKITGKATGSLGEYRLDGVELQSGGSTIQAELAYLTPAAGKVQRPTLTGRASVRAFDFTKWLAESVQEDEPGVEEPVTSLPDSAEESVSGQPASGKKLFPDEPIALGMLNAYDADFTVDLENVIIAEGVEIEADIGIKLDKGLLEIAPFDIVQSNGGTGEGHLILDARSAEANLDVDLEFDDFVSPRFGGLLDVNVALAGTGGSVAELMGGLDGRFVASLTDVELNKTFMSQFGAGLLENLNPLDSDKTTLECGVIRMDIDDGLADFDNSIAAQTTEVTWLGGGEINLKTEEIDVGIAPKARKILGSLTSVNLASLVHIGGTLADPRIGIDVADVAKKYVGYTAFVATGGWSFLAQKVFENRRANVDQCERILQELKD